MLLTRKTEDYRISAMKPPQINLLPNVKDEVARESLKIIPVAGGEIRLGIDVVINRETYVSPAIKTFLPVIEEYFNYQSFQQKVLTPAV
jgi:hypothetical protein